MNHFILTLLVAMILTSCSAVIQVDSVQYEYVIDFRPFESQGFLFTPQDYDLEYDSKGMIDIRVYAQVIRRCNVCAQKVKPIEIGELLNNIYNEAVAMDADAVVNLQIKDIQRSESGLLVPGINISGLAIKRN